MITSLSIKNFALIEKLDINFSSGFSVITGETGAGKSILLGALGLVLGKRADLSSLKNNEEKCIIEAHFDIQKYNLNNFFEANDLDYETNTTIRREILVSGKSRAFINDTPVNLALLQELSTHLLDIHSQHQTQELSDEAMQFKIIDAIANNKNLLADYEKNLRLLKKLNTLFKQKTDLLLASKNEQEYNTYLLEELLSANFKSGDLELLETSVEKGSNIELIKENLSKSISLFSDENAGVNTSLNDLKATLSKISGFSADYKNIFDRIASVSIECNDIEKELEQFSENVFTDPATLESTNQRLQFLYSLFKKHQVKTVDEILTIQEQLDGKVISVVTLETEIEKITIERNSAESKLNEIANNIHKNRIEVLPTLILQLKQILEQLGMANARFDIQIEEKNIFLSNGKDEIKFLFSANKGAAFGIMKKVASGGELSRIMLAVKAILAQYSSLPTLIFDEIDTGVSGEVAGKMADIMKKMSLNMQLFSITHLPQIAAKGQDHFKVYKVDVNNKTQSELKLLTPHERITEIAQMVSGATISEAALNHAKQLLNN